MSTSPSSFLKVPLPSGIVKPRALQTNFCEQSTFCSPAPLTSMDEVADYVTKRSGVGGGSSSSSSSSNSSSSSSSGDVSGSGSGSAKEDVVYVLDMGESDFGSRANFGRGHDHSALAAGCATSYDTFLGRMANAACNKLNQALADAVCVLGSVDCSDLSAKCLGLCASDPASRAELITAVQEVQRRSAAIVQTVYGAAVAAAATGTCVRGSLPKFYLVNGDHDHMTTAVGGLYAGTGLKPVVVYVDIHADSRPPEDGPHSGTWCCEIHDNEWVDSVYCVGLNPLSNSGPTVANLDRYGVVYEPYTWDAIKSGEMSMHAAADDVVARIRHRVTLGIGSDGGAGAAGVAASLLPPVILSICGDSVLNLPASAGTSHVGYSSDEVYAFIARVCSQVPVSMLTVAELKTSLEPGKAALVGEFLTQALLLFQRCTPRKSASS